MLSLKFGKTPLVSANFSEAFKQFLFTNSITCSAFFIAASESYGIPSITKVSAQPITPNPIRLLPFAILSISGSG